MATEMVVGNFSAEGRDVQLLLVPPQEVDAAWPHAMSFLEGFDAHYPRLHSMMDLFTELAANTMQLWLPMRGECILGACVTELSSFPQGSICSIVWLKGEPLDDYFDYLDVIESWAQDLGVKYMRVYGREGWTRRLRDRGYRRTAIMLHKEIGAPKVSYDA